jgi:hypothetical protein
VPGNARNATKATLPQSECYGPWPPFRCNKTTALRQQAARVTAFIVDIAQYLQALSTGSRL